MSKAQDVLQRALASAAARRKHRSDLPALRTAIGDPDRRLWYCTPDRVNLAHAEQLAAPLGLTVEHHEPRDGALSGHAILIDGDFWWSSCEELERGLDDLLAHEDRRILAIHGWCLDDDQLARLSAGGIHASNRLDGDLIALIASELPCLSPSCPTPVTIS